MRRFLLPILLCVPQLAVAQEMDFFTLAAGDIGGNYFATARAVCGEVNRTAKGRMRCSPESTPGSVYNLDGLASGQIDFAIVQSNLLASARDGTDAFASNGPMPNLTGVIALYQEQVTVLVGKTKTIATMKDFVGASIDLGPPASGRRATGESVLNELGVKLSDLGQLSELTNASAIDELCSGQIDAVVLVTGHPDAAVARAVGECGAHIVPFDAADQTVLADDGGLYSKSIIPAASYGADFAAVSTVAVTATLVTRAPSDAHGNKRVDAIINAIRDAKGALGRHVKVLADVDPAHPWPAYLPIPAHPAIKDRP